MGLVQGLVEWSQGLVAYGWIGLFVIAFMESSFFPIPPDILLIPLALAAPELALVYGLVATIGSVSGAFLGYYIGAKGGRPALLKIAGKRSTNKIEKYFNRYGTWAIGIAGFSPIPYKIFTIAAGVFEHRLKALVVVSIISRGGRFMLEAILILLWGQDIIFFLDNYFGLASLVVIAGVVIGYFAYRQIRKKLLNRKSPSNGPDVEPVVS